MRMLTSAVRWLTVSCVLQSAVGYIHNDPARDKTRPHNPAQHNGSGTGPQQQNGQQQPARDNGGTTHKPLEPVSATTTYVDSNKELPPFPHFRFISWDKISENDRHHAHKVGYGEKNWNKPGQHELEQLTLDNIHTKHIQVYDELMAMGFESSNQWDCYMNHYRALHWNQLGQHQIDYVALGWTQQLWETDDEPETEGGYWKDLTPQQQIAAANLCYTQELWDDVVLPLWGQDDGKGGENDISIHDTNSHIHYETQAQVDEKKQLYDTIYDEEDRSSHANVNTVPIGPRTAHNSRNIATPFFRYNPWQNLTDDMKRLAHHADYNGKAWNSLDTEKLDFETLGQQDPKVQKALTDMGFTAKSWDCFMIHYRSYEWDELKDAKVQDYYKTLGWNRDSWNEETDPPPTDGMYWPDLSQEQQDAAYELCYFRETWDEVSMQFWPRTSNNSPINYAKDFAKQHPAKAGGALVVTLTVLIGVCFACACCFRTFLCPGKLSTTSTSGLASTDLEMYRYDDKDTIHQHVYRDDPNAETASLEGSNSAKFHDAEEDYGITKASIV